MLNVNKNPPVSQDIVLGGWFVLRELSQCDTRKLTISGKGNEIRGIHYPFNFEMQPRDNCHIRSSLQLVDR